MAIQISITDALTHYAEAAGNMFKSPIPTKERLEIVLRKLHADMVEKREDWEEALGAELVVADPDEHDGTLDGLRAKLEKSERTAQALGAQYQQLKDVQNSARKDELMNMLTAADKAISKLEDEIDAQAAQLAQLRETTQLRHQLYTTAKDKFEELREAGPAMIARTEALKAAQAEKMAALEDAAQEQTIDAGAIISELSAEMEQAEAGNQAAAVVAAESAGPKSFDEMIRDEERNKEQSARINRWIGN